MAMGEMLSFSLKTLVGWMFLAVTDDSGTNIMSYLMAKSNKVSKIIALIENVDYFELTKSIGVDTLINKLLTANSIFDIFVRKGR